MTWSVFDCANCGCEADRRCLACDTYYCPPCYGNTDRPICSDCAADWAGIAGLR